MKKNLRPLKREYEDVILKLYLKGKFGGFPEAENKLQAAKIFCQDYKASMLTQRTTFRYEEMLCTKGLYTGCVNLTKQEATDRYLKALKATGKYKLYALHFLRDEENIKSFFNKYPVLNKSRKTMYRRLYYGLNQMLDKLVCFYDSEKKKQRKKRQKK